MMNQFYFAGWHGGHLASRPTQSHSGLLSDSLMGGRCCYLYRTVSSNHIIDTRMGVQMCIVGQHSLNYYTSIGIRHTSYVVH